MLTEYGGRMRPDDDVVFHTDLCEVVAASGRALCEAQAYVEANQAMHSATLDVKVAEMFEQLAGVTAQCRSGCFDPEKAADPADMLTKLAALTERVRGSRGSVCAKELELLPS